MKIIQVGTKVKYRTAAGKVRSATVVAVTSQTVISVRVGRGATATTYTNVSKVGRKGSTVGWLQ